MYVHFFPDYRFEKDERIKLKIQTLFQVAISTNEV